MGVACDDADDTVDGGVTASGWPTIADGVAAATDDTGDIDEL